MVDLWLVSPTFEQSFRHLWPPFLVTQLLEVSLIIYWSFFNRHGFFIQVNGEAEKILKEFATPKKGRWILIFLFVLVDERDSNIHAS